MAFSIFFPPPPSRGCGGQGSRLNLVDLSFFHNHILIKMRFVVPLKPAKVKLYFLLFQQMESLRLCRAVYWKWVNSDLFFKPIVNIWVEKFIFDTQKDQPQVNNITLIDWSFSVQMDLCRCWALMFLSILAVPFYKHCGLCCWRKDNMRRGREKRNY